MGIAGVVCAVWLPSVFVIGAIRASLFTDLDWLGCARFPVAGMGLKFLLNIFVRGN